MGCGDDWMRMGQGFGIGFRFRVYVKGSGLGDDWMRMGWKMSWDGREGDVRGGKKAQETVAPVTRSS